MVVHTVDCYWNEWMKECDGMSEWIVGGKVGDGSDNKSPEEEKRSEWLHEGRPVDRPYFTNDKNVSGVKKRHGGMTETGMHRWNCWCDVLHGRRNNGGEEFEKFEQRF
jgi:hypothetical protein